MEYDPEVVVLDDKEDGLSGRGLHQLISSLKSSFRLPDFNKVEEYLTLREQQLKQEKDELEAKMKKISDGLLAEIQKKEIENEFLERKHADEVLEKLVLEEDLRKCKRECEDLEEKVNRLSEDQKVMCGREKRAEERYGKLMEELKKSEECSAQLNCKNRELECEKRRIEAEIEMWKRRFGELESRVLALEKDTEVLKRPEPNFCESMKGNLGVRNPGFSEWRAEKEAGSLRKVKNEMDIESTSVSLENKKINEISAKNIHASPGLGSSCHTPTQRIINLQNGGSGRPAFVGSVDISDSDDEMPKVIRNASTDCASKEVLSGKQQPSQSMKNVMFLSGTGPEDTLKRKQEILDWLGEEDSLKVKQASSSTHNPVFLKRLKATINAEENIRDTYDISDSDDSSDSESEADVFPFDPVISIARSNQKGRYTKV